MARQAGRAGEVHALTRLYDLILWIIPVLEKFPRSQKFLLGDRMETQLLDIQDLLIQAAYSAKKIGFLYQANIKLEQLRYLVRLPLQSGTNYAPAAPGW